MDPIRCGSLALLVVVATVVGCDRDTPRPAEPSQPASTAARPGVGSTQATTSVGPSTGAASTKSGGIDELVSKPLPNGFVLVNDADILDSQGPFVGVIVPEAKGAGFYLDQHGPVQSYWTPTVTEVLELASALREQIYQKNKSIGSRLHEYRFQVVGVKRGSQRLLFVNGFCDAPKGWQQRAIVVDDGGDCYFQLSFDPAAKSITKLTVNGEA